MMKFPVIFLGFAHVVCGAAPALVSKGSSLTNEMAKATPSKEDGSSPIEFSRRGYTGFGGDSSIEADPDATIDHAVSKSDDGPLAFGIFADVFSDRRLSSCDGYSNIALLKPSTQSTTRGSYTADLGNDGLIDLQSVSSTVPFGSIGWWEVDLESAFQICGVKVFSSLDCCQDQLSTAVVEVFSNNQQVSVATLGSMDSVLEQDLEFTGGIVGDRVRITTDHSTNALTFAEFQVFGVPLQTPGPWALWFNSIDADFTAGNFDKEVSLGYYIKSGRKHVDNIYAGGCKSNQDTETPLNVTLPGGAIYKTKNFVPEIETGMDLFELFYDFNRTLITASDFWEPGLNSIKLCQIVQLVQERSEGDYLVIQEDIRNITIDFDRFANFTLGVNLTGAAINEANDTAYLKGYIDAYYCDGDDENMKELQAGSKLQPNDEMGICIVSSSTDIEIKEITSMVIAGNAPGGAQNKLPVMTNGIPFISAITSFRVVNSTSFVVITRVPISSFDYEAENASIDIFGTVLMNLKGSASNRQLKIIHTEFKNRQLQFDADVDKEAAFDLSVLLTRDKSINENEISVASRPKAMGGGKFALVGTILAMHVMW